MTLVCIDMALCCAHQDSAVIASDHRMHHIRGLACWGYLEMHCLYSSKLSSDLTSIAWS